MYQYLADNNTSKPTILRKDNYKIIISKLIEFLQQIPNNKSNNKKTEIDNSIPSFPFSIPKDLLPRDAEAEDLYNKIIKNRFFNLVGVGGSGKTSLTYLMMQKHRYDFNEIAYVVANNNIKDEFVEQLNVTLDLPKAGENFMYKKIIAFLEANYKSDKSNLLVLDINETTKEADNKKFIDELHNTLDNWNVLILSREHFTTFNYKNLNDNQDGEFIKKLFLLKAGDKYKYFEDFDGLFKFIDYTPILAEQLGLYLNGLPKKSLADIKKVFYGEYFRDEDISEGVNAINRHNKIVSFLEKLIDYNTFKPNAQKLLCHFILWQAEYIDYNVIKTLLKGVFTNDDDYENAIVALHKRAILTEKNLPNGSTSYKLHGLLAKSLRGQIDIFKQDYPMNLKNKFYSAYLSNIREIMKKEYNEFIPYADCIGNSVCEYDIVPENDYILLNRMSDKFNIREIKDISIREIKGYYKFIPYADCIGNSVCEYNIVPENDYILLNRMGSKFSDVWKTDYAIRLYNKSIEIIQKQVKSNPNNSAYQNVLANNFMHLALLQKENLNDYNSAEKNYRYSIDLSKKLPKDNPEYQHQLALAYYHFANLQQDYLKNYEYAERIYKKVIELRKKLPKNNPENQHWLALAYYNLANLQVDYLNDHKTAENNYKKAIKIGEQLPKHNSEYQHRLAVVYGNLAILQKNHSNDYKSAEINYKKAIEIKEQLPKNPVYQDSLAVTYNNFALFQQDILKNHESAETYFKKAIETEEPLLKVNRQLFLINWVEYKHKLAKLYFDTDKVKLAKSILEEIKPLVEECLAKNPNDGRTKDVNDWINDLWEKINK